MVGYDWCVCPDNCQLTCLALDETQLLWLQTCRHRWLILFHSMQLSVFLELFPSPFCRVKVCWILLPLLRASDCAFFQSRLGLVPFPKAMFGFPLPLPFTSDQHGHFGPLLQAFEASVPLGQLMCLVVPWWAEAFSFLLMSRRWWMPFCAVGIAFWISHFSTDSSTDCIHFFPNHHHSCDVPNPGCATTFFWCYCRTLCTPSCSIHTHSSHDGLGLPRFLMSVLLGFCEATWCEVFKTERPQTLSNHETKGDVSPTKR